MRQLFNRKRVASPRPNNVNGSITNWRSAMRQINGLVVGIITTAMFLFAIVGCGNQGESDEDKSGDTNVENNINFWGDFDDKDADGIFAQGRPSEDCELPIFTEQAKADCLATAEFEENGLADTLGTSRQALRFDDCNDNDATVGSGQPELCDGKDNDCEGRVDENLPGCCLNNEQCPADQACVNNACQDVPCGELPCEVPDGVVDHECQRHWVQGCCVNNDDCVAPLFCLQNGCRQCIGNLDCAGNETCDINAGTCNALDCPDDGNACTVNHRPERHVCVFDAELGCCQADADCNNMSQCVANACEAVPCDDGNVCTTDVVDNHACTNDPINECCLVNADCGQQICFNNTCVTCVDDGNCNPLFHCVANACEAVPCDDGNVCTTDVVDNHACTNTPRPACCVNNAGCNNVNQCVGNSCEAVPCDDGNVCTTDVVDNHACINTPRPACCILDADCRGQQPADYQEFNVNGNLWWNGGGVYSFGCLFRQGQPSGTCGLCEDQDNSGQCALNESICIDRVDGDFDGQLDECPAGQACNQVGACQVGACQADGDCGQQERCNAGFCRQVPCNDNNVCTQDSVVNHACQNALIANCCVNDAGCAQNAVCQANTCVNLACEDNNVCTNDMVANHQCSNTPIPGCCRVNANCPDGACLQGQCVVQDAAGCWPFVVIVPPGTTATAVMFWDRQGAGATVNLTPAQQASGVSIRSPERACSATTEYPGRWASYEAGTFPAGAPPGTCDLSFVGRPDTMSFCRLTGGQGAWGCTHDGLSCR